MKLDRNNTNVSYNFGRLVSIFDLAHAETNADTNFYEWGGRIRLAGRTLDSWSKMMPILNERLEQMDPATKERFKTELLDAERIFTTADDEEFKNVMENGFDATFVHGYYMQRSVLK